MPAAQQFRLQPAASLPSGPPVLDTRQREVVAHQSGPMLVLAGPGTGKTTTLVESVVARVADGCPPEQVLVLTFSRKAAVELRERIAARLGRTSTQPAAMTFHSLCYGLLRRFARSDDASPLGMLPPLRLLTAPEQDARLREVLDGRPRAAWPEGVQPALGTRAFASELRALWARARQLGMDPDDVARHGAAARRPEWVAAAAFFEEYLEVLDFEPAVDYTELVHRTRLLLTDPERLAVLRREVAHVYVDEYQDCDPAQVGLLRQLVGEGGHLVAVGDPDQSIYRFRGAQPRAMGDFATALGGGAEVPVVVLGTTRRFGDEIAKAVARVADRLPLIPGLGRDVLEKFRHPLAERSGGLVESLVFDTEGAQAAHVANVLRNAHVHDGVAWERMAVLVRSGRRQIPTLSRALVAGGVPVEVAGDELPLADHLAVRPLLDLLGVVGEDQPLDPDTAQRLLTSPLGGLDSLALRRLGRALRDAERQERAGDGLPRPAGELVAEALREPASWDHLPESVEVRALRRMAGLIADVRALLAAGGTAHEALWKIWTATPWADRLRSEAAQGGEAGRRADRDLDALCALFDLAARKETTRNRGVRDLLADVAAQQIPADRHREVDTRGRGVRLLTAHRAKGLEWDLVVVAGVQEGSWPDLRSRRGLLDADLLAEDGISEPEPVTVQLAEERRLFYVACTRARERLVVTAVEGTEGEGDQPSRFLADLGVAPEHRPGWPGRPLTLNALVAELRRTTVDATVSPALRTAAAARLARLAAACDERGRAVVPLASPDRWWGVREATGSPVQIAPPDGPVELSGSALADLLRCPRQWFLQRRVHVDVGRAGAATLGSVIHTLADLANEREWAAADMVDHLDQVWDQIPFEAEWLSVSERVEVEGALARYVAWREANPRRLVAAEARFDVEVEVPGDRVRLVGSVDRLEAGAGGLYVVDLKTGRHAPTQKEVLTMEQLGLYQLAAQAGAFDELTGGERRVSGAEAVYLRAGTSEGWATVRKQPSLEAQPAPDGEDLIPGAATWVHDRLARAAAVVRAGEFPATRCDRCEHCAFKSSCPAVREGAQVIS